MKTGRSFPSAFVTKKAETALKNGHPWVYGEEITMQSPDIKNGELVDVFSQKGSYLGTGFYSEMSKIKIRILSDNANETFSAAFFERRLRYAVDYRRTVMGADFHCCRLIFGEADGLPGLTVDRYESILVSEIASYGMEQHKDAIYRELRKQFAELGITIAGIYERNEDDLRAKEGLRQYKGWYGEDHPESCIVSITENGIRYEVDVA